MRHVLSGVELVDLTPEVLARALQPFQIPARTLDGLHLATMDFTRSRGREIELASYDARLLEAAAALGIRSAEL